MPGRGAHRYAPAMSSLVWLASRRDLGWRRRRLVMAVAATTLVLAITLLLSGFRDGFDVETSRTVAALGGTGFVVREGMSGPFTTVAQLDESLASEVSREPGVTRAGAIVSIRHTVESSPATDVYVVGARPGGLGAPEVRRGRPPRSTGEAVLDARASRRIGDRFRLGGREFVVVGLVRGTSVWAGVPAMFVTLPDAQELVFAGARSATSIVVRGTPLALPAGLRFLTVAKAEADMKRPLENAIVTIDLLRLFLWVVAAAIVGSVLYVSALERSRDFAVFKAVGAGTGDLVGSLVVEAVTLAALSAAIAVAVSRLLAGLFPAVISFPARTLVLLPVVAAAVGLVGSVAGARRAVTVDPSVAFAGP